jgi:hypothetical protein
MSGNCLMMTTTAIAGAYSTYKIVNTCHKLHKTYRDRELSLSLKVAKGALEAASLGIQATAATASLGLVDLASTTDLALGATEKVIKLTKKTWLFSGNTAPFPYSEFSDVVSIDDLNGIPFCFSADVELRNYTCSLTHNPMRYALRVKGTSINYEESAMRNHFYYEYTPLLNYRISRPANWPSNIPLSSVSLEKDFGTQNRIDARLYLLLAQVDEQNILHGSASEKRKALRSLRQELSTLPSLLEKESFLKETCSRNVRAFVNQIFAENPYPPSTFIHVSGKPQVAGNGKETFTITVHNFNLKCQKLYYPPSKRVAHALLLNSQDPADREALKEVLHCIGSFEIDMTSDLTNISLRLDPRPLEIPGFTT